MSYTESVLQPNERIIRIGWLHWIIYGRAVVMFVLATLVIWVEYAYWPNDTAIKITAWLLYGLALVLFLYAWFIRWITEFAVTNRRVIYKRGFIYRRTAEMNLDKVESVDVDQSVLGRLLNYGSVRVLGTGQGIEHLHQIAAPIELRNCITAHEPHAAPSKAS